MYLPPNIENMVLFDDASNIFNMDYTTAGGNKGSYQLTTEAGEGFAFNRGIHIMLKNLPNKSTMGSLNQGNASKLVAVVNKFDRADANPLTTYYAYNEYEHLYISLNNADWISTNLLSFELVDRFANYCKNINETTLVFHLKPMDKNLVEFYRANT